MYIHKLIHIQGESRPCKWGLSHVAEERSPGFIVHTTPIARRMVLQTALFVSQSKAREDKQAMMINGWLMVHG